MLLLIIYTNRPAIVAYKGRFTNLIFMSRIMIFVDGSNYYHSLKKSFHTAKVDFQKISNFLIKDEDLINIYFYVSPVPWQEDAEKYSSQQKYFEKLKLIKRLELILGRLEHRSNKKMEKVKKDFQKLFIESKPNLNPNQIKEFEDVKLNIDDVLKFGNKVEKGVDVNLAIDLVTFAFENKYDIAILISNDSDFVPAVKKAQNYGKKVYNVKFPKCDAHHLSKTCDKTIFINDINDFLLD